MTYPMRGLEYREYTNRNNIHPDTQQRLADTFETQQPRYDNGVITVPFSRGLSTLPTTVIQHPDGTQSPGHYMETDFDHPDFQSLYKQADNHYAAALKKNNTGHNLTSDQATILRLTIRNQVLEEIFPPNRHTIKNYEHHHQQLNADTEQPPSLSDYFQQGASVCIQRASLTAHYLARHRIPIDLEIQSLRTSDGDREQHAYLRLADGTYIDPTNPIRLPDESFGELNSARTPQELLTPARHTHQTAAQTQLELERVFAE